MAAVVNGIVSLVGMLGLAVPASLKPYAKAVVAFALAAVSVAVQLLWIGSDTGAEITAAITAVAVALGVGSVANQPASK